MCIERFCYCSRCRSAFDREKATCVRRGTVHTKCGYSFPFTAVDVELPLNLKKDTCVIRGTVYTKCVNAVTFTAVNVELNLNLKKVTWKTKNYI